MHLTLQEQLDAITERTRELVQPERLATTEQSIADLQATHLAERALKPGDKAPDFALPDSQNRIVRSEDLLALGPVILNFFRGRWCPYCVTELEAWRDHYQEVRSRGALLVAISPQTNRQSDFAVQQHALPFPLLRDERCAIAEKFGIAYTVSPAQQRQYTSTLVNIPFINGEPSWRLPLAATFVIGQNGIISYASVAADFRQRPEPEDVLHALPAPIR
ncbi:MAG TPA: peroxiredoxin-like family protein [Candidatus Elarobacter sp.]|nr:peroxiredoxin-like family protein [Candidatus Elarobacter sp.]